MVSFRDDISLFIFPVTAVGKSISIETSCRIKVLETRKKMINKKTTSIIGVKFNVGVGGLSVSGDFIVYPRVLK